MENEVRDDRLRTAFAAGGGEATAIADALRASDRGRRFIDEHVQPYQPRRSSRAGATSFIFPTVRER